MEGNIETVARIHMYIKNLRKLTPKGEKPNLNCLTHHPPTEVRRLSDFREEDGHE